MAKKPNYANSRVNRAKAKSERAYAKEKAAKKREARREKWANPPATSFKQDFKTGTVYVRNETTRVGNKTITTQTRTSETAAGRKRKNRR